MKKTKLISLLLVLATLLCALASCGDGVVNNGGTTNDGDGGDRTDDGSWENVTFKNQTVRYCISVNQYEEATFPAGNIYTKGPDQAGSNEVFKEVLARNTAACESLGINIEYSTRDLTYDKILEDVRSIVQTSSKNSPDIYNNDINGLSWSMLDGLLWNVKNPGEDVKNYFDFEAKGWYTEYIKGCTFDQDKYYIFAGDYFIDMIRMAWVVLVNNDLFEQNLNKMPSWCSDSVDSFYEYVADGYFTFDMLGDIVSRVSSDGAGGVMGETEKTDALIGFGYNNVTHWAFLPATGVTIFYQDKTDGYKPKVIENIDTFQKVADRWKAMVNQFGTFFEVYPQDCTATFVGGNVLFCSSRLGEMEAPLLRDAPFAKGLIPTPKWDDAQQEAYHTIVHDQTEIGCILASANAFSASSAYMQYLNENSDKVMYAYFEKGLKYKYNDDANSREMMDIVRESTDSPFGSLIGKLCKDLYKGTGALHDITLNTTAISSTFASEKDAYNDCLKQMMDTFAKFE